MIVQVREQIAVSLKACRKPELVIAIKRFRLLGDGRFDVAHVSILPTGASRDWRSRRRTKPVAGAANDRDASPDENLARLSAAACDATRFERAGRGIAVLTGSASSWGTSASRSAPLDQATVPRSTKAGEERWSLRGSKTRTPEIIREVNVARDVIVERDAQAIRGLHLDVHNSRNSGVFLHGNGSMVPASSSRGAAGQGHQRGADAVRGTSRSVLAGSDLAYNRHPRLRARGCAKRSWSRRAAIGYLLSGTERWR